MMNSQASPHRLQTSTITLQQPTVEHLLGHLAVQIHGKACILNTQDLPADQRASALASIADDIDKCISFVRPEVSHAALSKSIPIGVNLPSMGQHDQPLFDPDEKVFHFEHIVPISTIRRECLKQLTIERVLEILVSRPRVAWILKSEKAALTRLGRGKAPGLAYRKAGIDLFTEQEWSFWEDIAGFIYHKLVALLHRGEEDSFVIFEERKSQKFVQFGLGRCLGMDVPCVALSRQEADRASAFYGDLNGEGPREYKAPDAKTGKVRRGASFYHDFGQDASMAARAAVAFFTTVYRLPADVDLVCKES